MPERFKAQIDLIFEKYDRDDGTLKDWIFKKFRW